MFKFLIGPVLMGVGYAAGSYYGSDAEQVVHKSPTVTYAAVEAALGNVRQSGEHLLRWRDADALRAEHRPNARPEAVVTLYFDGKQGAEADIDFSPRDGGTSTLDRHPDPCRIEACFDRPSPVPARRGSPMRQTGCSTSHSSRCSNSSRRKSSRARQRPSKA